MPTIRAVQRSDLPAVLDLLRVNFQPWWGDERLLSENVMDHPWADQSLPSYVALDNAGDPVGFIGAQVRRLRFDGRTIHGVCCQQLGVFPDRRAGAAGALLLSRLLSGDQALTWSDSATERVARIWRTLGGHVDSVRACDWMFIFRPGRWLRQMLPAVRRRSLGRDQSPVGGLPFHLAGRRLVPRAFPDLPAGVTGADAPTPALIEHLEDFTTGMRLWVDHDAAHLDHLFGKVEMVHGPLVRRMVRRHNRPIGWYAYLPRRGGISRVLHVASSEHQADAVLGELLEHARAGGSAGIAGRAEPHLMLPLQRRLALLGYARTPIVHTRDPQLAGVLSNSSALLTRLDGEVLIT